ncbi:MAG TPA: ABC transporter ATP-binding protein, partial [Thermoanaerobaculia bacterium]
GLTAQPRESSRSSARPSPAGQPLLAVRDLRVEVSSEGTLRPAVDGISFEIAAGESLAVVGESGCGKTLLARALLDLLPEGARRTGTISFEGRELPFGREDVWSGVRGRGIGLVLQEPASALDPVRTIGSQIGEALAASGRAGSGARGRARELLAEVAFPDPDRGLAAYPHRLSGGQRQRALLATALAGDPLLLVADEPTASLDATVAAEVLDLIDRLRRDRGLALLLITHDIASAFRRADRALVLYAGRVVEAGPADAVFRSPRHPYTRALVASRPRLADGGPGRAPFPSISGAVPSLGARSSGRCAFAPRCPERFEACDRSEPELVPSDSGRTVRCFLPQP